MDEKNVRGVGRSRWAAFGAAVAVTLGVGSIAITNAVTNTNVRGAFVPITPCRLFDTRADNQVGPRKTPLAAIETYVQQVTGANGNCNLAADAVAVAFNVTTVNGTGASFLTVWPSDDQRPLASSLNWVAGSPPTPNKVDVKLSAAGKVSFYNNSGSVDVLADVVGYYVDFRPTGTSRLRLDPASFSTDGDHPEWFYHNVALGRLEGLTTLAFYRSCGIAPVSFPEGATITDVTAHVSDVVSAPNVDVNLWRNPIGVSGAELMFSASTTGSPGDITLTGATITTPVIDNAQYSYFATVCGLRGSNYFYDMSIGYTNP